MQERQSLILGARLFYVNNGRGASPCLFFWGVGVSPASAGEASRRKKKGQFGQIFQNPRTRRKQNKTMKNTRGEHEGGRQPPLANRLQSFQSADDSDGGSRQIMSESVGHSRTQAGGQTRGNCTRGKPPGCGLAAPSGSRQIMSQPLCRA